MSSCRFHAACVLIAVATASIAAGYSPPSARLEQQLKTRIDIDFENTPLKEVLNDLRDMHGINIVPDKPALDEAGISLDSPISMKLERVALKSALKLILRQVKLTYIIKDDVLQITTREHAQQRRATYQVADLVNDQWTEARLIDLVTKSVAPRSWSVSGGKGTIVYSGKTGLLAVFQTSDVQEQVADMVSLFRRIRSKEDQCRPPAITPPPAAR